MGTESCSLKAFLREPPCGTCKKEAGWYQITGILSKSPDQNKQTNKAKHRKSPVMVMISFEEEVACALRLLHLWIGTFDFSTTES